MSNQFKHFFFDWDGCLVDTLPVWHSSIKKAFSSRSIDISDEDVITHILPHLIKALDFGITDFDAFVLEVLEVDSLNIHKQPMHTSVNETLTALKKFAKLALITSGNKERVWSSIHHNELSQIFDVVITREDVEQTKPHPEAIEKALKNFQANKESTIMIGDSAVDIQAGKAAGIKTAVYFPTQNERYYNYETIKSFQADYILREFSEILDL